MSGVARQLHLFKGKRQRGLTPPPAREFATHCALADMIRRWIMPGWKFTHLPFGELRTKKTAGRLQRMGVTSGWPDFIFLHLDRRCVFLELKRRGSTLSDVQREIATFLLAAGHDYLCTSSFEEAVDWLKQRGVLRAGVQVQ